MRFPHLDEREKMMEFDHEKLPKLGLYSQEREWQTDDYEIFIKAEHTPLRNHWFREFCLNSFLYRIWWESKSFQKMVTELQWKPCFLLPQSYHVSTFSPYSSHWYRNRRINDYATALFKRRDSVEFSLLHLKSLLGEDCAKNYSSSVKHRGYASRDKLFITFEYLPGRIMGGTKIRRTIYMDWFVMHRSRFRDWLVRRICQHVWCLFE